MNDTTTTHYLPPGLPVPVPEPDSLSAPYWSGLREGRLRVQHCAACGTWQFGPEWLCHRCHAFDPAWEEVAPRGRIFSWERVWHPAHAALKGHGAYLVVLVELPEAGELDDAQALQRAACGLAGEIVHVFPCAMQRHCSSEKGGCASA